MNQGFLCSITTVGLSEIERRVNFLFCREIIRRKIALYLLDLYSLVLLVIGVMLSVNNVHLLSKVLSLQNSGV